MGAYGTGKQTLRIDVLPEDVRKKILALANQAQRTRAVTSKQVEYVLDALENGLRREKSAKGWEKTNTVVAVGRVALGFFDEHPEIKTKFRNHISKLQKSGLVKDAKPESEGTEASA